VLKERVKKCGSQPGKLHEYEAELNGELIYGDVIPKSK